MTKGAMTGQGRFNSEHWASDHKGYLPFQVSVHSTIVKILKGYKGYKKKAFSQEVRLLACS